MGLITEDNAHYYSGQQSIVIYVDSQKVITWRGNVDLVDTTNTTFQNYRVLKNNVELDQGSDYSLSNNVVTVTASTSSGDVILIELLQQAKESNYGGYAYTTLSDIINNFQVAYVGEGKLIPSAKKSDIIFHAKRGLQEFSYDTLKSIKPQEINIPPSLSVIIPHDYVNYVALSYIDEMGIKEMQDKGLVSTRTRNEKRVMKTAQGGFVTPQFYFQGLDGHEYSKKMQDLRSKVQTLINDFTTIKKINNK